MRDDDGDEVETTDVLRMMVMIVYIFDKFYSVVFCHSFSILFIKSSPLQRNYHHYHHYHNRIIADI